MNRYALICLMSATLGLAAMWLWSCSSAKPSAQTTAEEPQPTPQQPAPTGTQALPRAVVYRTTADYSRHVAVNMDASGQRIVSFPDPRDLRSTHTTPIALSQGFLLDRRGLSPHAAFLSYTIDEYAALSAAPPIDTLMARIICAHPIAEMHTLPISAREAWDNPQLCEPYIANGFQECDTEHNSHPSTLRDLPRK